MDDWPLVVLLVAMGSLAVMVYAIQTVAVHARHRAEADMCIEFCKLVRVLLPIVGRRG